MSTASQGKYTEHRAWTLTLPYDKPPLSLNDRGQTPGARAKRSALAAQIKRAVILLTPNNLLDQDAIHVRLHYQPKDRRRRDADNLVATLKPCIDGLVAAGVVPDDCAPFVDWSAPRIHEPADDRKPRLWLEITANSHRTPADGLAGSPEGDGTSTTEPTPQMGA